MTRSLCLDEERLIEFVDDALPRESMQQVELHVRACSPCQRTLNALKELCADVHAPLEGELDVPAHVEAVLARLDRPAAARLSRAPRWFAALSGLAAAAALAVFVSTTNHRFEGTYGARGGASAHSLGRDVGVQPFAYELAPRRLSDGSRVRVDTPLGASFRNRGNAPAYLLLFALDASGNVHWISPPYTRAGSDPAATLLPPSQTERTLETTAVLDDIGPGPLRVVSLITLERTHVSDIERLAPGDFEADALQRRFVGSVVQTTTLALGASEAGAE